ncbi:sensor histidine kinase [Raoultibacter phocaeensis]|uniref:sensor histidine kinase n=1 Tax=Raoultibacter phocaeensis TaxID=2479841 RepID=UPI0015D6592D|nr:histidine kinase [Raoultibacter phocaeensis]
MDKTIVLVGCVAVMLFIPFSASHVVGLLVALAISGFAEGPSVPQRVRGALLVAYVVIALFVHEFSLFVPLIAYDCMRSESYIMRFCWVVCPLVANDVLPVVVIVFVFVASGVACTLSYRTTQRARERVRFLALRDELHEASMALERKNRDLLEKQDNEVTLATLNERSRIAREIHDNVGHLLTRSVLQIEALQVVHAHETQVKGELEQVGATLHEALDTVRRSVHDLHDESLDLRTQLTSIAESDRTLEVELDYKAEEVPSAVGYCFIAIVRESLANAAKHSDAERVHVSVVEYPAFWRLTVHDNGSAPESDSASGAWLGGESGKRTGTGIGLQTMEDRARALGGVFRAEYERGFRIFVTIPKETA